MANTTDLMITSFFDEEAIRYINNQTGLDFRQVSDGCLSGGSKVLSFNSFGTCERCIGAERIRQLISIFKNAPFDYPQFASLLICDDNNEEFDGIVLADGKLLTPRD